MNIKKQLNITITTWKKLSVNRWKKFWYEFCYKLSIILELDCSVVTTKIVPQEWTKLVAFVGTWLFMYKMFSVINKSVVDFIKKEL